MYEKEIEILNSIIKNNFWDLRRLTAKIYASCISNKICKVNLKLSVESLNTINKVEQILELTFA